MCTNLLLLLCTTVCTNLLLCEPIRSVSIFIVETAILQFAPICFAMNCVHCQYTCVLVCINYACACALRASCAPMALRSVHPVLCPQLRLRGQINGIFFVPSSHQFCDVLSDSKSLSSLSLASPAISFRHHINTIYFYNKWDLLCSLFSPILWCSISDSKSLLSLSLASLTQWPHHLTLSLNNNFHKGPINC